VALFLAPYLRKFGQFTVPDFLGERYGGNLPRFIGIVRRHPVLVHLCRGADLGRGPDHVAPDRGAVRRSASSWASAASWCAPFSAACAP
jgi:hypothetical protein